VPPLLPGSSRRGSTAAASSSWRWARRRCPEDQAARCPAAALLFVAVFPGNVYMALEPGDVPRWAAVARLPLQVPLVLWAVSVWRRREA
jgi:hypothetical protein